MIIDLIKDNLILVGLMTGLYFLFAFSNIMLGLYLNVKKNAESFELSRLWNGVLKSLALATGLITLTVGVSIVPVIFNKAGIIVISEDVMSGISVLAVITIIAYGVIEYASQCVLKVQDIFNKNPKSDIIDNKEVL